MKAKIEEQLLFFGAQLTGGRLRFCLGWERGAREFGWSEGCWWWCADREQKANDPRTQSSQQSTSGFDAGRRRDWRSVRCRTSGRGLGEDGERGLKDSKAHYFQTTHTRTHGRPISAVKILTVKRRAPSPAWVGSMGRMRSFRLATEFKRTHSEDYSPATKQ